MEEKSFVEERIKDGAKFVSMVSTKKDRKTHIWHRFPDLYTGNIIYTYEDSYNYKDVICYTALIDMEF